MRSTAILQQPADVLPMATAQKVKMMIIKRGMKPGDRLPIQRKPVYPAGSDEVPPRRECRGYPPGKRNLRQCRDGNRRRSSGSAFHKSGESDP